MNKLDSIYYEGQIADNASLKDTVLYPDTLIPAIEFYDKLNLRVRIVKINAETGYSDGEIIKPEDTKIYNKSSKTYTGKLQTEKKLYNKTDAFKVNSFYLNNIVFNNFKTIHHLDKFENNTKPYFNSIKLLYDQNILASRDRKTVSDFLIKYKDLLDKINKVIPKISSYDVRDEDFLEIEALMKEIEEKHLREVNIALYNTYIPIDICVKDASIYNLEIISSDYQDTHNNSNQVHDFKADIIDIVNSISFLKIKNIDCDGLLIKGNSMKYVNIENSIVRTNFSNGNNFNRHTVYYFNNNTFDNNFQINALNLLYITKSNKFNNVAMGNLFELLNNKYAIDEVIGIDNLNGQISDDEFDPTIFNVSDLSKKEYDAYQDYSSYRSKAYVPKLIKLLSSGDINLVDMNYKYKIPEENKDLLYNLIQKLLS